MEIRDAQAGQTIRICTRNANPLNGRSAAYEDVTLTEDVYVYGQRSNPMAALRGDWTVGPGYSNEGARSHLARHFPAHWEAELMAPVTA